MGGLLFQGKLSPKNISFNFPQTLPNTHSPPLHTHTPPITVALLCYAARRLKWPLWAELNICVHSGRASECLLPPAASAPGSGCQPARRPTSLNPCQAPDATLGGPAHAGLAGHCSNRPHLPSSLAPPTAANKLAVFPMRSSTESQ